MSIFVNLTGGLGNQLFQIANGYAYAKRHNKELILSETWREIRPHRFSHWHSLLKNLQIYLKPKEGNYTHYGEPRFEYKEIPTIEGNVDITGYYQSEKYFKDCEDDIHRLFSIPESFLHLSITPTKCTVAIHIRRGDYLKASHFHTILPKTYYDTAKEIIEKEIGFRPNYFYFSDDRDWVKENFKDSLQEGDIVITNNTDDEDFIQMRNCHHFIIANSTFSWWAAWLSITDTNKKVICPNRWFNCSESWWEDIYCKNWIRI